MKFYNVRHRAAALGGCAGLGIAEIRAALAEHKNEIDTFRRVGFDDNAYAARCECELAERWIGIKRCARRAGARGRAAYVTAQNKTWEHLLAARVYMSRVPDMPEGFSVFR